MLTQMQVLKFLQSVDNDYPVPLSHKTDLAEFSHKIVTKSDYFAEVSNDGEVLGLMVGYIRNVENEMAYMSALAVLSKARGQGIAEKLVKQFLAASKEKKLQGVHLYAVESNEPAVQLYRKLGFEKYMPESEPRPNDLHLVYWFKEKK